LQLALVHFLTLVRYLSISSLSVGLACAGAAKSPPAAKIACPKNKKLAAGPERRTQFVIGGGAPPCHGTDCSQAGNSVTLKVAQPARAALAVLCILHRGPRPQEKSVDVGALRGTRRPPKR
jgi:hypothetical protein